MRASVLIFGALLASCANPKKTGPTTGASVASAPVAAASPATPQPVSPPGVASAEPAASAVPAAPSAAPAGDSSPGAPDRVPVYSRFEGCLTEPDPEATASRAMPKPDRVEVTSAGGAIRVAHHLNHPCCLKAATRVERAGTTITLVEELSGTPCRCRCASVVHSQLAVPEGEYDLRIRLEQPSGKTEAHQQAVKVSGEPSKPKLPPRIKVNLDASKP